MSNFTDWLWSEQGAAVKDISRLIEFSKSNQDTWPKESNDQGQFESYIRKRLSDDTDKADALIDELKEAWQGWKNKNSIPKPSPEQKSEVGTLAKLSNMVTGLLGNVAAIIAIIVVVAFLFVVLDAFLSETGVLTKVSDVATARGAITFLFAFGTIILALMLVGSALFGAVQDAAEFQQRKERFNQGKEILSILIGILGTIVGFYFGTPTNTEDSRRFVISDPIVINSSPAPGEPFSLVAQASGGTPPYNYTVIFDKDFNIDKIENRTSGTGLIVEEFQVPDGSEVGKEHTFIITVSDLANRAINKRSKITVK